MPDSLDDERPRLRLRARHLPPSPPRRLPTVTAVIPTYNYGRYLPECVQSLLSQRDVELEVRIIDDCSTDDTPNVAADLAQDPRVKVIRNDRNLGLIASVNRGFDQVEGDYLVKLDADDLLTPGSLARATALLETHSEVGFVYGRPLHFSGSVPVVRDAPARSWTLWAGREWIARRCRSGFNVISQPEVVMRTATVRQVGQLPAELPHTSDLYLWLRLASLAQVARVNGPAQGLYRVHDASMQRTIHAGILVDLEGRRDAFEAALHAEAGRLDGAPEMLNAARQALAAGALDRACRAYDRGRVSEEPVDKLLMFATEVYPGACALPEWSAFERRRSVGAERAPRRPRFFTDAVARRAAEEIAHWRWLRTGEL